LCDWESKSGTRRNICNGYGKGIGLFEVFCDVEGMLFVFFLPKATEVRGRKGMSYLSTKPQNTSGSALGKTPAEGTVK